MFFDDLLILKKLDYAPNILQFVFYDQRSSCVHCVLFLAYSNIIKDALRNEASMISDHTPSHVCRGVSCTILETTRGFCCSGIGLLFLAERYDEPATLNPLLTKTVFRSG